MRWQVVLRAQVEEKCVILSVRVVNVIRDITSHPPHQLMILQLIMDVKKVGGISAA